MPDLKQRRIWPCPDLPKRKRFAALKVKADNTVIKYFSTRLAAALWLADTPHH